MVGNACDCKRERERESYNIVKKAQIYGKISFIMLYLLYGGSNNDTWNEIKR